MKEINLKLETKTIKGGKKIKLTIRNMMYHGFWGKLKTKFYWSIYGDGKSFKEYLDSPITYIIGDPEKYYHGDYDEKALTEFLIKEFFKIKNEVNP